jgi:Secretion system C-terminal sorting domain
VSYSQSLDTILRSFSATIVNEQVVLNWIIKEGNSCNGIEIYRSTDGFIFNPIGDIPGICGGTPEEAPYQFIDETPQSNAINYYKIELGNNGFSNVVSIQYIKLSETGYLIAPNPITNQFNIYFKNPKNKNVQLELFSIKGKLLKVISSNKKDFIEIKSFEFPSGIYVFKISGEDYLVQGKFVKT